VPPEKLPYDFFTIGLAEVLIRAGYQEEGNALINNVIRYSKQYLDYASGLSPGLRFGLDYAIGINMQSLLDIYTMAGNLKLESLSKIVEPDVNRYYSIFYSAK
jgi:hypothetical protein